jgi:hypothetical protein
MIKPLEKLTKDAYMQYGDRKEPGRISVLVDVVSEKIYAVPKYVEHVVYAPKLKKQCNVSYEKLVPAHIDTNGVEVIGVSAGYSGLEKRMGIRHSEEDLQKAKELVWKFVNSGSMPKGKIVEDSVAMQYIKK